MPKRSIEQIAALLTEVSTGDGLRSTLTSDRINAMQEFLFALARGENIKVGRNISKRKGDLWCQLHGGVSTAGASGTSTPLRFFQLVDATERDITGAVTARKVRVVAGTIDGDLPTGMNALDAPPYLLTVSGSGEIYAGVAFDDSIPNGVSAPFFDSDTATPTDEPDEKYRVVGGFSVPVSDAAPIAVNNVAYGPFYTKSCPNFFDSPLVYSFEWVPTA